MTARKDWRRSTLKERIDHLRELRDITQNELGERAGIRSGPMSKLITRPRPSAEKLAALAAAWDVSLDWLARGVGQPVANGASPIVDRWVELTDRYPETAEVLNRLQSKRAISAETAKAIREMALHAPVGLEPETISALALEIERKQSYALAPADEDTPPRGRKR